jgi:hypothetical protein
VRLARAPLAIFTGRIGLPALPPLDLVLARGPSPCSATAAAQIAIVRSHMRDGAPGHATEAGLPIA